MPRFEHEQLQAMVIEQNYSRKTWADNSPEYIKAYIQEEFRELVEALVPLEVEQDRYEIASEIGDIEYLSLRYAELTHDGNGNGNGNGHVQELPDEIQFLRTLAWQTAEHYGLNIVDCLHLKIVRNDLKYPPSICSMHPYDEGRAMCKQMWGLMGGDKAFYTWYESIFGKI